MLPNSFIYGFLGGFLLSFVSYFERINDARPEKDNGSVQIWKDVYKIFEAQDLIFCFVYALIGGVLAWVLNPQSTLLAFYIGMTAYPTLSKFAAMLNVADKSL